MRVFASKIVTIFGIKQSLPDLLPPELPLLLRVLVLGSNLQVVEELPHGAGPPAEHGVKAWENMVK